MIRQGVGARHIQIPPGWLTVAIPRSAAATGPIVYDTFTDSDGVYLNAHTPDIAPGGSSWSLFSSNSGIRILSNYANSYTGDGRYAINSGISDCIVSGNVSCSGNGATGFVIRASDVTHLYIACVNNSGGKVNAILYERNGGGYVQRATSSGSATTFTSNTYYPLVVTLNGSDITVSITGTTATCSYSSSLFATNTYHGFRTGDANDKFDNFSIDNLV